MKLVDKRVQRVVSVDTSLEKMSFNTISRLLLSLIGENTTDMGESKGFKK